MTALLDIDMNYTDIVSAINESGNADRVEFIAVSKFQPVEKIKILLEKGHRSFAESRVEEAVEKWTTLKEEYPDVRLHFIGGIQSKKIKKIVSFFDVIQSVDRLSVAEKIADEIEATQKPIECLIQVNIGKEDQKSGVQIEDLGDLYQKLNERLPGKVSGFMCIPPNNEPPAVFFKEMVKLKEIYGVGNLSMGMSADYLVALENGSTMLRVGSMIFGERNSHKE
ncbi:YggS family pyridoxal phosphate-dependent enzyme [Pseudomonas fluorescens]|uniref:YggS family pyridoxal phosphate-dependent enzyme n=1 Tax=Pseudomonas fluorescens TaxID=294 RepID=UPI003D23DBF8